MEGPVAANDIMEGSIMLVLSRKVGESILISESIRVTVVQSTTNGRIRLGIEAPPEVIVLREELTKFCSKSSPSQNGKAEARPPSAELPRAYRCSQICPCENHPAHCQGQTTA